jgi:hypothetical protein
MRDWCYAVSGALPTAAPLVYTRTQGPLDLGGTLVSTGRHDEAHIAERRSRCKTEHARAGRGWYDCREEWIMASSRSAKRVLWSHERL